MTAIRDRQSDPDAEDATVPWDERLVVGERRGLPWWGAVLVGFGLAVLGAIIDEKTQGSLEFVFKAGYFLGALIAVGAVQRRALFGPMVQPPLVLAVTVPAVVLITGGSGSGSDTLSKLLNIGTPLINGFPTMAVTTGVTLLFGFFRIFRERDPDAAVKVKSSQLKDGRRPRDADEPQATGPRTRPPGARRPGQAPPPAGARRPTRDRDPRDPRDPRNLDGPPPRRPRPPADPSGRPRRTPPPDRDPRGTRQPPPPDARRPRPPAADDPRRRAFGDGPPPRRRPRTDEPPPGRPRPPRREPPRRPRPWEDES